MKTRNMFFFLSAILVVLFTGVNFKLSGEEKMSEYNLEPNVHHALGIALNGQVWSLLEKKDRKAFEDSNMIAFAKGSLYHWSRSPQYKPVNEQRGEWMISRVYSVLNKPEEALKHAKRCRELTEKHDLKGFDLAYSYEALARAYAISGNKEEFKKNFDLANEAGEKIQGKEDKEIFMGDLKSGTWNGMK